MSKIVVRQSSCQIQEEHDYEFLSALDNELSFDIKGAEYTSAYSGYYKDGKFVKWDGKQRLLSSKLVFAQGLLERVLNTYKLHNKEVEIVDERIKTIGNPIDLTNNLIALNKTPRQYQIDAANLTKKYNRGIIRIPTGGGKTLTAALMTAMIGKKTIIYVIGKDLLHQFHQFFSSVFNQKIGIIGDGICEIADINIASIWTVGQAIGLSKKDILFDQDEDEVEIPEKYQNIRDLLKEIRVHIFDECHYCTCDTIQGIYKNINPEHIYGMSASPWRDDGSELLIESILGKNIIDISASFLIENGWLVKPKIKFIRVPPPLNKDKHYQTIYKNYIVNNSIRNDLILKNVKDLVNSGNQVLVLFNSVNHGKILYDLIKEEVPCSLLSGKDNMDTRTGVKKQLELKEINCVIASKIFDIGVDLPSLTALVLAGSGKSSVRAIQRIGRVIRPFPNKKEAIIIDFNDQAKYLKNHSKERQRIYNSEVGFEVIGF